MNAGVSLNERAHRLVDKLVAEADGFRTVVHAVSGARVIDCGIETRGSLRAGVGLARICMAGLARVSLHPGVAAGMPCPVVAVHSDRPLLACMASQYAGWQISVGKYFAMGSGPMRAAYGKEALFDKIPGREKPPRAVGVLETRKLPDQAVIAYLAEKLALEPSALTLLVAPASSMAGSLQVVARSLETALHKLYELGFELGEIVAGFGSAPMPPIAKDELKAIGWTNDAILYAGRVVLWVDSEDDRIAEIGPKVPSSASPDHGAPFAEIFERSGRDFYKIDPMLFSPAQVVFHNLRSGRCHAFGCIDDLVLGRSFASSS